MAQNNLQNIYEKLLAVYGKQHWWPTTTNNKTFEIIIGAILTQNTSWGNVERAILNLGNAGLVSVDRILKTPTKRLAHLIRPAGYYNQKAERLKIVADFFNKNRNFGKLQDIQKMREELLNVKGIGPETADSILLYAFNKPSFVIDAYTRRIFSRIGICEEHISYDSLQGMFHKNLDINPQMFNEYHALIVEHAKRYCSKKPGCRNCVLLDFCKSGNVQIKPTILNNR